jgi:hypothetical protein
LVIQVLYRGPNATPELDAIVSNPIDPDKAAYVHRTRGGWVLSDYLTYDW